jgi:DNA polymerase delta subunit 4
MPPKRRTTTPRTAGAQRQISTQSTLSFNGKNRVSKPQSSRSAKFKKDPEFTASEVQDVKIDAESDVEELMTPAKVIEEQSKQEANKLEPVDPLDTEIKTEDILGGRAPESDIGAVGGALGSGWIGDEGVRARKIKDTDLKRYWRAKESERKAPRVHQEDLPLHEKILREWDMSGQYGPCIGIARLKRWKRANMLSLNPPIEVLAVLLKEMDAGDGLKGQKAYVDELMSSRFVET